MSPETRAAADAGSLYEIRLWGSVDPSWTDLLHGMSISVTHVPDKPPITRLTGRLVDRTALASVLDVLFDRGYTLISVRLLEES